MFRWKDLKIPARGLIWLLEDLIRKKRKTGALVSCRHDDHIALYLSFSTRTSLRNAFCSVSKENSLFRKADNISTQLLGLMVTDLMEDVGVNHWRFRKKTFIIRSQVFQISVEEFLQQ